MNTILDNPIIFLDIDGVLNSFYLENKLNEFIPESIAILNYLYLKYNAYIVISSSWREFKTLEEIKKYFENNYFIGNIIDKTDVADEEHSKIDTSKIETLQSEDDFYLAIGENQCRNYEIMKYINENNVDKYVVIDDMLFSNKELSKHHIRTNNKFGLTLELVYIFEDAFYGKINDRIKNDIFNLEINKDTYLLRQNIFLGMNKELVHSMDKNKFINFMDKFSK